MKPATHKRSTAILYHPWHTVNKQNIMICYFDHLTQHTLKFWGIITVNIPVYTVKLFLALQTKFVFNIKQTVFLL